MNCAVQVYKARLSKAHNVAVKEFRETHSAQQQLAVMMEVAILKNCHSPHIVQFMGACIKVGLPLDILSISHEYTAGWRMSYDP